MSGLKLEQIVGLWLRKPVNSYIQPPPTPRSGPSPAPSAPVGPSTTHAAPLEFGEDLMIVDDNGASDKSCEAMNTDSVVPSNAPVNEELPNISLIRAAREKEMRKNSVSPREPVEEEMTTPDSPSAVAAVEEEAEKEDEKEYSLERLMELAIDLDLVAPPTPILTEEDRQDLALFDRLTQAQAQIEQVKGIEAEVVESETWNYDAAIQLGTLATTLKKIPFASRPALFDLRPTASDPPPSKKGKERAEGHSKKRAIYHMLPKNASQAWFGPTSEHIYLSHIIPY